MLSRLSSAFEPVACTVRSDIEESVHTGVVIALNADGSVAFTVGDAAAPIYPRSAMKPLQATGMLELGLKLPPHLLALVCSSHDGRDYQLAAAREILSSAGQDERALANTADLPLDADTAAATLRAGKFVFLLW